MTERFKNQLQFLIEADKMKNILRQTLLVDKSRRENDAEHSWHFALMAMILFEYADRESINLFRVLKMALIHDLVEIYAGDTFAYDLEGNKTKQDRENKAADRLFGLLPDDQGTEIRDLWAEFDNMQTPDSKFAASVDRFQPFINNYMTQGHTWKLGNVTCEKVYARMDIVRQSMPELWGFVETVISDSVSKGYLHE